MSTSTLGTQCQTGEPSVSERVSGMAADLQHHAQEMGAQIKDVAEQKMNEVRDSAAQYYEQGRERAQVAAGDMENYIREQPTKSLLIAAGIGAVLGVLWVRR